MVVQLGGFAPAAKRLNRSQSTISYAISRLEEQLGIKLFELKGRKAELTETGGRCWPTPNRFSPDSTISNSARILWSLEENPKSGSR